MITLQIATVADIKQIYDLAYIIWHQHYIPIIGKQQVAYMLDKMYNDESLTEQMLVKKHTFYLIKTTNDVIGFVSVSGDDKRNYFIQKFYINQTQANKGIGTEVLNELTELLQPICYELTVNRQNIKSINFYFKNGFKITNVADFDIGNGFVMNDFVMKKIL